MIWGYPYFWKHPNVDVQVWVKMMWGSSVCVFNVTSTFQHISTPIRLTAYKPWELGILNASHIQSISKTGYASSQNVYKCVGTQQWAPDCIARRPLHSNPVESLPGTSQKKQMYPVRSMMVKERCHIMSHSWKKSLNPHYIVTLPTIVTIWLIFLC